MNDIKIKNWTGKQLVFFSEYIWTPQTWGWSLLALHSTIWGMKMFDMLKLKWSHILNDDYTLREDLEYEKNKESRPIAVNGAISRSITRVLKLELQIRLDAPIYVNHIGKALTTSTLNREFNGFIKAFRQEVDTKTGLTWNLKPIKTNTFQIAWALDMLNEYEFNSRALGIVSRHLGHNSIADTVKLLEIEPYEEDELFLNFNYHSFRYPLNIQEMPKNEVREEFYSVPSTGTELWESEHLKDYPL